MKVVKSIFYFFISLVAVVVLLAFVISKNYGDKIKQYVVNGLNKHLLTEVKVGNVDFTVLKSFPYASVEFQELTIYSSLNPEDTLIHLGSLSCKFSLLDLYHENYRLLALELRDGFSNMVIDEKSNSNFEFWGSTDSSGNTNFSVQLENIEIYRVDFRYSDLSEQFSYSSFFSEANIDASLSNDLQNWEISSTTEKNKLWVQGEQFLFDTDLAIEAEGIINLETEQIDLITLLLELNEIELNIKGSINYKNSIGLILQLEPINDDLNKVLSLIPPSYLSEIQENEFSGDLSLSGSIIGEISEYSIPHILLNYTLKNTTFQLKETKEKFQQIQLNGRYTNGEENNARTSKIELRDLSFTYANSTISGNFQLSHFLFPVFTFTGNVSTTLVDLIQFSETEKIKNPGGNISAEISIDGRLNGKNTFGLTELKKSSIRANLKLKDLSFSLTDSEMSFSQINASISVNNQVAEIKELTAYLSDSRLDVSGLVYEPISTFTDENFLFKSKLNLKSDAINLDTFQKKNQEETAFSFPNNLDVLVAFKVNDLQQNSIHYSEVQGDLNINKSGLDLRNLKFLSHGGETKGDLYLRNNLGKYTLRAQFDYQNINVKDLFADFKNFDQEVIKSENLEGISTGNFTFSSALSPALNFDLSSLTLDADLLIKQGVLKNVTALESLSKFISLEELRHIKFKTLTNHLSIKDCTLVIPKFDIQSSAMNLSLEGSQHFNGRIDYHFTAFLNEVLSKKVKKPENEEFGYVEDDGLGRSKVFVKLNGTIDKPVFSYDSKELKSHLKVKVEEEKKTLKSLLKEEFGLFKKDSSLQFLPPKKKEESPFQIEWEETKSTNEIKQVEPDTSKKIKKKGKFGKLIDKIAKPNEDEFVEPDKK